MIDAPDAAARTGVRALHYGRKLCRVGMPEVKAPNLDNDAIL